MLVEKYGSSKELEEYTKVVAKSLAPIENRLISKYIKRGNILDIGCGAGREAIALAKKGFEVVGIDIVPKMVLRAKETSKLHGVRDKIRFEVADVKYMDYDNESFNAVVMLENMIEHIRGRNNRIKLLRRIKRVLKPNGTLIFSTHTRSFKLKFRLYWTIVNGLRAAKREFTGNYRGLELGDRYVKKVSRVRSKGKVFIHIYTFEEALEDIKNAGLSLLESKCAYEIEKGVENIKRRKRASQVFYVVRKT